MLQENKATSDWEITMKTLQENWRKTPAYLTVCDNQDLSILEKRKSNDIKQFAPLDDGNTDDGNTAEAAGFWNAEQDIAMFKNGNEALLDSVSIYDGQYSASIMTDNPVSSEIAVHGYLSATLPGLAREAIAVLRPKASLTFSMSRFPVLSIHHLLSTSQFAVNKHFLFKVYSFEQACPQQSFLSKTVDLDCMTHVAFEFQLTLL